MKNITRLALAFAVAALACLSPMAHAEDEAALIAPVIPPERLYDYWDKDGPGKMVVKDGPRYNGGRLIYVTLSQKGYTLSGKGWRALTKQEFRWLADCEFWVSGGGLGAKFSGQIYVKPPPYGDDVSYGAYYLNGSGTPYEWECQLDIE